MKRLSCLLVVAFLCSFTPDSRSCTTFTIKKGDAVVYGRNMDWHLPSGLVCINARGLAKKALVLTAKNHEANPAQWVSKYGNVTFNCVGKEFPTGGMNEEGLVIDVMWLEETRYPKADERPEMGVFQWTQYLLDTCRDVDQVLAAASKVRISEGDFPPQHFLMTDRDGKTCVIEFLDGKMQVRTGQALPYCVLANSPYDESRKFAAQHSGLGGEDPIPHSQSSNDRFTRAASQVRSYAGPWNKLVDYSFGVLHSVNAGYELNKHATVWSIVYDGTGKAIHFRTNGNREIRTINLAKLDFSNQSANRAWPIVDDAKGDITRQSVVLTDEMNRAVIIRQVTHPVIRSLAGDMSPMIDIVAAYPSTCAPAR